MRQNYGFMAAAIRLAGLLFLVAVIGCSGDGGGGQGEVLQPNLEADPLPTDIAVPEKTTIIRCGTFRDEKRGRGSTTISGQVAAARDLDKLLKECISLIEAKGWKCTVGETPEGTRGASIERGRRKGSVSIYSSPKRAGLMLMIQIEEPIEAGSAAAGQP